MIKRFKSFVARLPFSGKFIIGQLFMNLYTNSPTPTKRAINYLILIVLLAIYIIAHGYQAQLGLEAFLKFNSPPYVLFIFFLYSIINISVVIVQAYLAIRATMYMYKSHNYHISFKPHSFHSNSSTIIALLVTLAGQLIFCAFYFMYI